MLFVKNHLILIFLCNFLLSPVLFASQSPNESEESKEDPKPLDIEKGKKQVDLEVDLTEEGCFPYQLLTPNDLGQNLAISFCITVLIGVSFLPLIYFLKSLNREFELDALDEVGFYYGDSPQERYTELFGSAGPTTYMITPLTYQKATTDQQERLDDLKVSRDEIREDNFEFWGYPMPKMTTSASKSRSYVYVAKSLTPLVALLLGTLSSYCLACKKLSKYTRENKIAAKKFRNLVRNRCNCRGKKRRSEK